MASSMTAQQVETSERIYRGDKTELTYQVEGVNLSTKAVQFVAKADRNLTSARVIQKQNAAAGGSSAELEVNFTDPHSSITVKLLASDTADLTQTKLYWDLSATDPADADDHKTYRYGEMDIVQDVQSPFDGDLLPRRGEPTRTITSNHLITLQDKFIRGDCSSAALQAELPAIANVADGTIFGAKKVDSTANVLTLKAAAGELIDGFNSFEIKTFGPTYWVRKHSGGWDII